MKSKPLSLPLPVYEIARTLAKSKGLTVKAWLEKIARAELMPPANVVPFFGQPAIVD